MDTSELTEALLAACREHLVEVSPERIRKCVGLLSEEEIWSRANPQCNSVGNLILHLCGNVRQHIIHGLGGAPDHRKRDEEFSETGPIPAAELLDRLELTMREAGETIGGLDPAILTRQLTIQGSQVDGVTALIHVTEHFSYHTGQITHMVKAMKSVDTAYYAGEDLNVTG